MAGAQRKWELSWLDLAFCLMVLFSHCSSHPITHLAQDSAPFAILALLQRLSFVSVYGFFFLSGVKLTLPRTHPQRWGTFYLGRVKTLLLPYLTANLIYYAYFCAVGYLSPSWRELAGYLLRGDLVSPFYFLIVLFQLTALAPLLKWTAQHIPGAVALPLALIVSWGSELYLSQLIGWLIPGYQYLWADRTFTTYLVYYLAGCYAGAHYQPFCAAVKRYRLPIALLFLALAGADLYLYGRLRIQGIWSDWIPYAHLAYLLAAILFCFYLALWIGRPLPRGLAMVEQASFSIYLYHSLPISILEWIAGWLGIYDIGLLFALRVPLVFLATPAACILWQRLVRRADRSISTRRAQK